MHSWQSFSVAITIGDNVQRVTKYTLIVQKCSLSKIHVYHAKLTIAAWLGLGF